MVRAVTFWIAFVASLAGPAALADEFALSYSGRLTVSNGAPVTGPVNLSCEFFDAPTGGNQLGVPKTFNAVPLVDGVFQVKLQLTPAERGTIFPNGLATWIELEDSTNHKKYPRQSFSAVPLALRVPVDGTSVRWNSNGELESPASASTISGIVAGNGLSGGGSAGSVTLAIDYSTIPGLDASGNAVMTALDGSLVTSGSVNAARLPTASATADGKVTSADWSLFNSKEPAILPGTALQYWAGNKSWQLLDTSAVPEGTRQYFTVARAKAASVVDLVTDGVTDVAPSQNAVFDQLALKQSLSAKGQVNGYADLDGSGKVPLTRMPFAGLTYKGTWAAGANTPTLTTGACGAEGE